MVATETETKAEEMKPQSKPTVQDLLDNAPPEVRIALEAMQRTTRSKKALTQPAKLPELKYFRLE